MAQELGVLVVDDEPKIGQVLEQMLTSHGCRVRVALDGLQALEQFRQQAADMVVTDIRMPKMDGLELLRELKHLDPLLNVVVITAYPSLEGAVEAMKYGACDFLTKPFDTAQLQAILYRCRQRILLNRQLRHAGEGVLKLEELNRRLAELNDLKSRFLAALSHEVNTPLCLMSEWLYLLSDETLGPLSKDQEHATDVLIQAYERLQRILQQLIDLMQGPEIVLQLQDVSAQVLLGNALDRIRPKAEAKRIALPCQTPQEAIALHVDAKRCAAALEYLLDNAVKFTHEGGRVEVELISRGATIQMKIRDTGIGIPPQEQDKVFAPFYQVDRRLNRAYEGAGIGLTLARRYLELHGGTVSLESQPNVGTTVVIELPRQASRVALPARTATDTIG